MLYYFIMMYSITHSATISSGEAAEEWNRGVAQRAERWSGGASDYDDGNGDKHNLIVPSDAT